MPDDVILGKAEIIENCLKRIDEVYQGNQENLYVNITHQDSILLNLERACQATIDLAMRWIRLHGSGVPKESREAFQILEASGLIDSNLSASLQKMVGFRNIAIHAYRELNLKVVEKMISANFFDIREFVRISIQRAQ